MNSWIQHVKQVQREHGISYKDALKVASKSYNGGSIASEKVRRFLYKKGFNPAKIKNPSKFISDGKYIKAKQTKSTKRKKDLEEYEKETERLRNINYGKGVYSKGLIYEPNRDYSKYFIKGMPNPKSKGGKIRGKGILDTLKNIGSNAGKSFPLNPFDMGYALGHDVIAPELKKIK